jgi:SAM-dependent methyltransferase
MPLTEEKVDTMAFALTSRYYDLIYRDKDTAGEVDYIETLLKRFGSPGDRLLELGCGSGRHGTILAGRGWRWHGVERAAGMVERARQKGLKVTSGSMEDVELEVDGFDAGLSLFHVVSYLTEDKQLNQAFANLARALVPGGLFIFDIWFTPAVSHLGPESRTLKVEDDNTRLTRRATPEID